MRAPIAAPTGGARVGGSSIVCLVQCTAAEFWMDMMWHTCPDFVAASRCRATDTTARILSVTSFLVEITGIVFGARLHHESLRRYPVWWWVVSKLWNLRSEATRKQLGDCCVCELQCGLHSDLYIKTKRFFYDHSCADLVEKEAWTCYSLLMDEVTGTNQVLEKWMRCAPWII